MRTIVHSDAPDTHNHHDAVLLSECEMLRGSSVWTHGSHPSGAVVWGVMETGGKSLAVSQMSLEGSFENYSHLWFWPVVSDSWPGCCVWSSATHSCCCALSTVMACDLSETVSQNPPFLCHCFHQVLCHSNGTAQLDVHQF